MYTVQNKPDNHLIFPCFQISMHTTWIRRQHSTPVESDGMTKTNADTQCRGSHGRNRPKENVVSSYPSGLPNVGL